MSKPTLFRRLDVHTLPELEDALCGHSEELEGIGFQAFDTMTRGPDGEELADNQLIARFTFNPELPSSEVIESSILSFVQELGFDTPKFIWSTFGNEDWNAKFKERWQALEVAPRVWVAPTWKRDAFQKDNAEHVIWIDPGMAFGTGDHPTTRLCAQMMVKHTSALQNASVADIGCGTGILALLAESMGAQSVDGLDNDPDAIRIAIENAKDNLSQRSFYTVDWDALRKPTYDVTIANIIAPVLRELAPQILKRSAKPNNRIILSGIINHEADETLHEYVNAGRQLIDHLNEGDWNAYVLA